MDVDFQYSDADFRRVQTIAMREGGICLPDSKKSLVQSRLLRLVRETGSRSYSDLIDKAEASGGKEILTRIVFAITTNVTNFFREKIHFDHLEKEVLTPAARNVRDGGRLRLWSSACSSGQEPWSMALSVMSTIPDAVRHDVKILGTDLNADMVNIARAGTYSVQDTGGIPEPLKKQWMVSSEAETLTFSGEITKLPTFNPMNLNGAWPFRGSFDAIFCRNVVIYFDEDTKSRLWKRLAERLLPGGFIYIGHSERIEAPSACGLEAVSSTIYRKR